MKEVGSIRPDLAKSVFQAGRPGAVHGTSRMANVLITVRCAVVGSPQVPCARIHSEYFGCMDAGKLRSSDNLRHMKERASTGSR